MAAKILIVEDDKSLREIYGVRLQAEGYTIVSASDGEQALAVAIKERPELIITDVMMPKITGFDMLDILRSTAETKDIKVIVMTALSSDDQRLRGERMGSDRYLVKSQVGIEDVVRTVHEVLADAGAAAQPAAPAPASPPSTPPTAPSAPAPASPTTPAPASSEQPAPSAPAAPVPTPPVEPPAPQPPITPPPTPPEPSHSSITPVAPSTRQRTIQPLNNFAGSKVDINELLDRELAKEAGLDMMSRPRVATTDQEKAIVENQLATAAEAATAEPEALQPPEEPATDSPAEQTAPNNASTPRPAPATPSAPQRPSTPLQAPQRPPVVQ